MMDSISAEESPVPAHQDATLVPSADLPAESPASAVETLVRDYYQGKALPPLPLSGDQSVSVLEKLGQPPFPRNKFPFLGFLASVYDHISERAHLRKNGQDHPPEAP